MKFRNILIQRIRVFLLASTIGLPFMQGTAQESQPTLFLISNSHLDTQWNWDVKTTINDYVRKTLTENMALMDKYPAFMLNYEGAIKYMWMKEYYPTEFEQLKSYVANGQWHISGMSVDANDVMVSSAESILHSMLYANRFYMQEFGVRGGYDIMLPDCFGFSYALPSLAHHAGIKGFHTAKLAWGAASYNSLAPFGVWQGVDGSQIYGIYKPGAYDSHEEFNKDMTSDQNTLESAKANASAYGVPAVFRYVGPRSDHGGGLQDKSESTGENTPYWLNLNAQKEDGDLRVVLATPDDCFQYLDSLRSDKFQVWDGELPMRSHGVGSYTSWGLLKRWNRKTELLADAAEKASSLASWLGAKPYPSEQLRDAWIRMLWQQHHDGITGTSILAANDISYNEYYLANKAFGQELRASVGSIASLMDTQAEGLPMVVYNPLSQDRTDVVEAEVYCLEEPDGLRVMDPEGKEVLSQIISFNSQTRRLRFLFAATVPSLGCAVFDVRLGEPSQLTSDLTVNTSTRQISNGRYRITVNAQGDIGQLYDLQNNRALMSTVRQQMIYDHEDTWPAWEVSYTDVCRTPSEVLGSNADIVLVEDGPLRKSYRIERQKSGSTFVQYIRMNALSHRVDCVNEVDWQTPERMLKVQFPFTFSNENSTYDISLGTIKRGIRNSDCYEVQGHQWADHSTVSGLYGVSILNDCKYGWDKPDTRTLRLTLLHTPSCGGYKHQANMDIGPNHFTYSILPHDGGWNEQTQMEASRLNQPLVAFTAPAHPGALGRKVSLARLNTDSVSIKTLKKAEDSDELIVRLYEWTGNDQENVRISFSAPIESAREVNALEEEIGPADFSDSTLTLNIGHYQPRTFAVRLKKTDIETDTAILQGSPVSLTYNIDVMSYDKSRGNATTLYSYAYPAEQVPDTLWSSGVCFVMGDRQDNKRNAVRCSGQEIALTPQAGENKLCMLMASANNVGSIATVIIGNDTTTLQIPYYAERAAQPLTCTTLESHYTTDCVALDISHAHAISNKTNETMLHMMAYRYSVPLPQGASSVRILSNDSRLLLLAATTSSSPMDDLTDATPITTEIDYQELGRNEEGEQDGRLEPRTVTASHQNGTDEAATKANDQDITTKWCVTSGQSQAPWLQYTFAQPVVINRWMVLGAARESGDYVARAFTLQYQDEDGTWTDTDIVTENMLNKCQRTINPITTQAVRLQMKQGEQGGYTTRIYEFAVYGHLQEETSISTPTTEHHTNGILYDLQGRQVCKPKHGIYILNGHKVLIK
ncbi:MAG: glycoside hydrolase family 38 C-terminal domain-containing protein [Bacteroidaceae bacterium]